jgi:hypothetical protein
LLQSLLESRNAALAFRIVGGQAHRHADTLHALGLLPPRHQRPRRRRAAEQRDELAPSHVEHRLALRSRSAARSACRTAAG